MCKVSSGIDTAGCKCRFVCRNLLGKCWELIAALLINKSTLGSKLGPSQLSGRAMWVGQAWILIWVTKPVPAWAWARTGLGACRVQLCKRCTRKCYRKSLQNRNRVWKLGKRKTKLSCIRRLVRKTKTKNEATILKVNSYENENEKRRSPNS